MPKFYSFLVTVFTTKINTMLGFAVICFLGISMSALIISSYSDPEPTPFILGVQTVNHDLNIPPVIPPDPAPVIPEKEIFISLNDQTLVYMEGAKIIGEFKISSGVARLPTPPGEYTVLKKKPVVNYRGATYNFPNTKWNLMFKAGSPLNYYIHGAFWHHNFGRPMSHGCVNVSYADMEGLYNWADEGTKIIIQQESLDNLALMNANVYPTPPGSIIAGKVTDNSIATSWNAATDPSGVAGYQIYLNDALVATTSALKYEASGLTSGTTYQFAVFAYNQSGSISVQPEKLSVITLHNTATEPSPAPIPPPVVDATPQPPVLGNTYTVTVDASGNINPAVLSIKVNDTVNFAYPNPEQEVDLVFNPNPPDNLALSPVFTLRSYKFPVSGTYTYKAIDRNGNSASIIVN